MMKILVIEKDFTRCKKIVNTISRNNLDLKVYSITFERKETLELVKEKVDIIILNMHINNLNGTEILDFLEEQKLFEYEKSIIVIEGNSLFKEKIINNRFVYAVIPEKFSEDILFEQITDLYKRKIGKKDIIRKINNELRKLNFNFAYKGTRYMADSIYLLYLQNNSFDNNLKQTIYPIVSNNYQKDVNTIYSNIKNATKLMFYDCSEENIKKYFNSKVIIRPKPKQVMFEVLKRI